MLSTVAIQTPRNSRESGGASVSDGRTLAYHEKSLLMPGESLPATDSRPGPVDCAPAVKARSTAIADVRFNFAIILRDRVNRQACRCRAPG